MSTPKKHHFVPRWYLEKFADKIGWLNVYDKTTGLVRRQRPENVMVINQYYRQAWAPEGVDPYILERALANKVEPDGKRALEKLVTHGRSMTAKDLAELLVYIAMQRIRVPRQARWAMAILRQVILLNCRPETLQMIREQKIQLTINDSFRMEFMRIALGQFHPWFARMKWRVINAGEGSFVTTDSPVTFWNVDFFPPAEPGVGLAGTVVLFPLAPKVLLLFQHSEYRPGGDVSPSYRLPEPLRQDTGVSIDYGETWDIEQVNRHNWTMVQMADRFVVSDSRTALEACSINPRSSEL